MSELRERIATMIVTAENKGWSTIVVPTEYIRSAFVDQPAGIEARLRSRALRHSEQDAPLDSTDADLMNEAADMLAVLTDSARNGFPSSLQELDLIETIDVVDHAILHTPSGPSQSAARALRAKLWAALAGTTETATELPTHAGGAGPVDCEGKGATDAVRPADLKASSEAMTGEDGSSGAGLDVLDVGSGDVDPESRLRRELEESKRLEKAVIERWLQAHEASIDAERRALKAERRALEAIERCAMIAEIPVELPADARALRLAVHAVQRHIASAIRIQGAGDHSRKYL